MNNIWILSDINGAGNELESTPVNGTQETENQPVTEDANGNKPGAQEDAPPPPPFYKNPQIIILGIMFIVMYFLLIKGPKKKQEKHSQMVKGIKKSDKIQTIGGIIGTVTNVKDNDIVIKIDESTNAKMTISKGAVSKILSDDVS